MTLKEELEILRGEPIQEFTGDLMDIPCVETSDSERLCKHPVVSVSMITYNHEPYIRQAIEGVMMQKTDFEFELVIGEDCSRDKTREICFEYQKRYPDKIRVLWCDHNLYRNPHPAGGNSRRNMVHCRGEFIALCEGDDYWTDPLKLQKQVDMFRTDSSLSIVYTDFVVLNQAGKFSSPRLADSGFFNILPSISIKEYLTERFHDCGEFGFFATASIVFDRLKLERAAAIDQMSGLRLLLGDYQLRTRAAMCGKVGFVRDSCVVYRLSSGVLGSAHRRGDLRMTVDILYAHYFRTWNILNEKERQEFISDALDGVLRVENCPWRAKLRVVRFYLWATRQCGVIRWWWGVRLLILFHIIPHWIVCLIRKRRGVCR